MAMLGLTTVLAIDDGTSSAYVTLDDVYSITSAAGEVSEVDVTNLDSANRTKEFIPGMATPSDASFKQRYTETRYDRLLDLYNDNTIHHIKATFPDGSYQIWPFFTKSVKLDEITPEGPMSIEFTYKTTSDSTLTNG